MPLRRDRASGPAVDVVMGDEVLPARQDVVVIGGGIIGVAAALALAERGVSVTVVEKGEVGAEQSSRNWGWCRQACRDPREFDLIRESLRLWRELDARVGCDTGFRTTGILFAAGNEAAEQGYAEWVRLAATAGISAEIVRGTRLADLLPGDTSPPRAALHCASDGRAEPARVAPAMARAAQRRGARVATRCAARAIERSGGAVSAVVTERGTIRCEAVVVAGGAWSRRILQDLGITLAQLKVRSSVARTSVVEGGPAVALWDEGFAIRRRLDGGYTLASGLKSAVPLTADCFRFMAAFLPGFRQEFPHLRPTLNGRFLTEWREARAVPADEPSPYEASRILSPAPDSGYLDAAFITLGRRYPVFREARIVESWAGYIDSTPDAVPVIAPAQDIKGLVIATGFSGHGFGIAPGAGELVADIVTGAPPLVDPGPFRWPRSVDGSWPAPYHSI